MTDDDDEPKITETEFKIMNRLKDGESRKMIAVKFKIAITTVHTHIRNVYRKFNVGNLAGALKRMSDGRFRHHSGK